MCAKASSGCAVYIINIFASPISFRSPHFSCCYSSLSIVIASHVFYSIASMNVVSDNKNNAHLCMSVRIHLLSFYLVHTYTHMRIHFVMFSVSFSLASSRFESCGFVRSFTRSMPSTSSNTTMCYHIRANHNFQSGFLVLFCVGSKRFLALIHHRATYSIHTTFGSFFGITVLISSAGT